MDLPTILGEGEGSSFSFTAPKKQTGYTLLLLMFVIFILSLGLLIAVPVWETQLQREKEEELIFRGRQYVEAIRLFQQQYPGTFPRSLDELLEKKCLRRLYPDPMAANGEWDLILIPPSPAGGGRGRPAPSSPRRGRPGQTTPSPTSQQISFQKVLIVPAALVAKVDNPQIIGVVSSSPRKSIKIYYQQKYYNQWLFFYGQDPQKMPEIVYFGQEKRQE